MYKRSMKLPNFVEHNVLTNQSYFTLSLHLFYVGVDISVH